MSRGVAVTRVAPADVRSRFLRYHVHDPDGGLAADVEVAEDNFPLLAEILERAVEGVVREGKAWIIR